MSVPIPEVMQWHNYDPETGVGDPSTPLEAARLNEWSADLVLVAEAAEAFAAAAAASAEDAAAPTDAMVAGLLGSASATRSAADARYALDTVGGKGVVRADSLVFNVKDYGALGNNVANDAAAIQAAITAAQTAGRGTVYFPAGIYLIASALTVSAQNISLLGAGRGVTVIKQTTATGNVLTVSTGSSWFRMQGFSIDRTVTPTTGNGIDLASTGNLAYATVSNLYVANHNRGIRMGPTAFSSLSDVIVEANLSDGIFITNSAASTTLQWTLHRVLTQGNSGNGIAVFAQNFSGGQIALGNWSEVYTFANTLAGISIQGLAAVPVNGLRLANSFVGEDGASVIFLNTYGSMHLITNTFIEGAGTAATGRGLATPASNLGYGIYATADNGSLSVIGGRIQSSSESGIFSAAARLLVAGVMFESNGVNAATGAQPNSGIFLSGGDANITGNYINGSLYGVWLVNDDHMVTGNRIVAATQAVGNTATLTTSLVANNRTVA